jgi:hypothetical protein
MLIPKFLQWVFLKVMEESFRRKTKRVFLDFALFAQGFVFANFKCKVSTNFTFSNISQKVKSIFLQMSVNLSSHTWAVILPLHPLHPFSFHQLTYIHNHTLINLKKGVFLGRLARSFSYGGGRGGAPC